MGRIKTKQIKRITFDLLDKHRGLFQQDFVSNKASVKRVISGGTGKLHNAIAGYITRLMKNKENLD